MQLSRAMSKALGRLLIGVVLLAQFAVASYACPGLVRTAALASTASPSIAAAMPPGCDQMDPGAANLCAAHCHQGQQSADTAAVHVVDLGTASLLYLLPIEPAHSLGSGRSSPALDARLSAAPEPPHAILHCVFRI